MCCTLRVCFCDFWLGGAQVPSHSAFWLGRANLWHPESHMCSTLGCTLRVYFTPTFRARKTQKTRGEKRENGGFTSSGTLDDMRWWWCATTARAEGENFGGGLRGAVLRLRAKKKREKNKEKLPNHPLQQNVMNADTLEWWRHYGVYLIYSRWFSHLIVRIHDIIRLF